MIYLSEFTLPDSVAESNCLSGRRRLSLKDTHYPFGIFDAQSPLKFSFSDITLFCGGNGCGKSTLLNIIANKLGIGRDTLFAGGIYWHEYIPLCKYKLGAEVSPDLCKLISSDDVFDYLIDARFFNCGVENDRKKALKEYGKYKEDAGYRISSMSEYKTLKKHIDAWKGTPSSYIRNNVIDKIEQRSNGENALLYFSEGIKENALYLLDEPENSLSVKYQEELKNFITDSVRFFGCQFIISTHSPILMSIPDAIVYDLDDNKDYDKGIPSRKSWTELENVRLMYEFFRKNENLFESP